MRLWQLSYFVHLWQLLYVFTVHLRLWQTSCHILSISRAIIDSFYMFLHFTCDNDRRHILNVSCVIMTDVIFRTFPAFVAANTELITRIYSPCIRALAIQSATTPTILFTWACAFSPETHFSSFQLFYESWLETEESKWSCLTRFIFSPRLR